MMVNNLKYIVWSTTALSDSNYRFVVIFKYFSPSKGLSFSGSSRCSAHSVWSGDNIRSWSGCSTNISGYFSSLFVCLCWFACLSLFVVCLFFVCLCCLFVFCLCEELHKCMYVPYVGFIHKAKVLANVCSCTGSLTSMHKWVLCCLTMLWCC